MPQSYPDVTRNAAASTEVQEEGRKSTTPASPGLTPQLSPNSNTNLLGFCLDLCFSYSCFGSEECASIYKGRRLWEQPASPRQCSMQGKVPEVVE
jgi:hypothetical protein